MKSLVEMHDKFAALATIRLFVDDEEFMQSVFACIHANTTNQAIREAALDAFSAVEDAGISPDLPTME